MDILIGVLLVILFVGVVVVVLRGLFSMLKFVLLGSIFLLIGVHFFVMPVGDVVDQFRIWKSTGFVSTVDYDRDTRSFEVLDDGYKLNYSRNDGKNKIDAEVDLNSGEAVERVVGIVESYLNVSGITNDTVVTDSDEFIKYIKSVGGAVNISDVTFRIDGDMLYIDGEL